MGERVDPKSVATLRRCASLHGGGDSHGPLRADERLLLDDHHRAKEAVALTLIDLPRAG